MLIEILKEYRGHHLKLLDLFETRQTWAFNFALIVYASALGSLTTLCDKPTSPTLVAIIILVISLGLPLLILPICFLYVDVSVYCAALNVGNIRNWKKQIAPYVKGLPEDVRNLDAGSVALQWLDEVEAGKLGTLHWVANLRMMLFFIAPLTGSVVSLYILATGMKAGVFSALPKLGLFISLSSLAMTFVACHRSWRIRRLASNARLGS
jgi:hypothetical protein